MLAVNLCARGSNARLRLFPCPRPVGPVAYPLKVSNLKVVSRIDQDPATYVRECSTVLREFNHLSQDSGNVSWLVESAGQHLFVKTAGTPGPPAPGAPVPYFDHAGRVRLLRNAVDVARSCDHHALPALLNVIESPMGPALVYEAACGDLIRVPSTQRGDPASPYQRLAHLPASALFGLFDTLIDLHVALAAAGWVAGDLYDGCLIVDFRTPNPERHRPRFLPPGPDNQRHGSHVRVHPVHGSRGVRTRSADRRANDRVHPRANRVALRHPADRGTRRSSAGLPSWRV